MPIIWIWLLLVGSTVGKPKLDEDCELSGVDTMVRDRIMLIYILYIYIYSIYILCPAARLLL